MELLDYLACKYLVWRLKWAEGYCATPEDWKDGEVYADGGCYQCKANLVQAFLRDYPSL